MNRAALNLRDQKRAIVVRQGVMKSTYPSLNKISVHGMFHDEQCLSRAQTHAGAGIMSSELQIFYTLLLSMLR
jgi:hypothetical protein